MLRYKPWSTTTSNAWNSNNEVEETFIQSWKEFLTTNGTEYVPSWATELESVEQYYSQDTIIETNVTTESESVVIEDWMIISALHGHHDFQQDSESGEVSLESKKRICLSMCATTS